jgi:class 3 adenylate cyclase
VQRFLGEGGRKRVYLAHDSKLDRDVAIAVIKTEGLDEAGLARVQREAQAMGRLGDHPHIVTIHDIGEEDDQPYIVSQYMGGGDLEGLIQRAENHRLPLDQALRIASEVRDALEHAHGRGIIHRDLKPGNIWLTEAPSAGSGQTQTAKLGDFGLAVALDRSRLTTEGMMLGTAAYMPPEQALGREADARSDLYSLGCVWYEMVTGRPPFLGDDAVGIISQHINTAPVAPSWHNPEVPRALENLILSLLAKDPQERPESATAVGEELGRIQQVSIEQAAVEPSPAVTDVHQAGAWGRFVGRRQELDQLKGALEDTLSGRGRLMMLVGEPGIGKTRLAQEFAVYASLRGAQVLTGRCYEGDIAIPYMPFVEAFREYVRGRDDPDLRRELDEGAPEVAKLVSEIRQRFPDIPEAPPLEGDAERLRLFESVTGFVRNASAANPIVIVLDDIHWADKPSLLLLQYLARGTSGNRVLLLGAYRDVELDRAHPLSEVVAGLRRERLYQRVLLRGLPAEDVRAMLLAIAQQAGTGEQEVPDEAARAIYGETEGNPFFVEEILKHLVEEGKLYRQEGRWVTPPDIFQDIPEGIREVIGRRLSRLSEGCNRMLTLASTMAGSFSWELLLAVSGEEEDRLLDLLDEALRALVVRERRDPSASSGQAGAGTYEFTHALIRQTLYGELNTPRRVRLHRQIGEAMERAYGANPEPHLAELAHHFFQAAPGGDVDKAIDYATRAAERALSLTAYEEAAGLYDVALQAMELRETADDEAQRCELLLTKGEAQNYAGNRDRAKETFLRAAEAARKLKEPESLARAVLGFAGVFGGEWGVVDDRTIGLLEEALDALGEEDSALRALLLSRLGMELWFSGSPEPAELPSRQSVEVARRVGDPKALADALWIRNLVLGGPEHVEERLAAGTEVLRAAEEAGARERGFHGYYFRIVALLELGDREAGYAEIEAFARLAKELRLPHYLGWATLFRATRAMLEGQLDEAERLNHEALALVERAQEPLLAQVHRYQILNLRRVQGRLEEVEADLKEEAEAFPTPWFEMNLVCLLSETGRKAEARAEFEPLAAADFADLPRDGQWLTIMALLSRACAAVADDHRAAILYDLLLPYAGHNVVIQGFTDYDGSASYYLGLLAVTMTRWEDAARHFEDALEMNERMGARPWVAWTQHDYADMLLACAQTGARPGDKPGDSEKALELVTQALDTAQELGMKALVEKALALKLRAQGIDTSAPQTSIDAVATVVQNEQPDLRSHAAPDGTVTILFTDIEGSTAMTERLGDQRWFKLLRQHNAIIRKRVQAHEGFEVKSEGDGFMLAFGSARSALQCAAEIQRAFAQRNESADEPIRVRIGLHTGEAIKEADDFYGKNVILAARIAGQAQGGEILVSSLLKELTESAGDIAFGEGREVELKGLAGPHQVFEVGWEKPTSRSAH